MVELIEAIVKPLVDYPEDVRVDTREDDKRITFQLSVHEQDIGKVIGKQGRTAKAIRTILYSYAHTQTKKRVYLEILD